MEEVDLQDPGSARGAKRSNSITSLAAWEHQAAAAAAAAAASGGSGGAAPLGYGAAAGVDIRRAASLGKGLSRFYQEPAGSGGNGASRSASPSPAPTPVRRAERGGPPAKLPRTPRQVPAHVAEREHAAGTAFELVQSTHSGAGLGHAGSGFADGAVVYKGVSKHK